MKSIFKKISATIDGFVKGEADFDKAKKILPFFYYFLFFIAFSRIEGLNHLIAQGAGGFDPRWPIFWAQWLDYGTALSAFHVIFLATALLASWKPYSMLARIASFIGLFTFHAYTASYNGPLHQWDVILWVSFLLIFLPKVSEHMSHDARRRFSLQIWLVQAFSLLIYTMSGIGKLWYGVAALFQGQPNIFSIDAGALHIATLLNQMHESTILGPWILNHPASAFLPFLAVLYLQLFSIVAAFRPKLHRLWGLAMIIFQVGTFLTMRAIFTTPTIPLLVFLLTSPFAVSATWRETLLELPGVKLASKILSKKA